MSRSITMALACAFVAAGAATFLIHPSSAASAAASDGKAIFATKCAACHQANGAGGGPYPPLVANADVTGSDTSNLILTVLNGRSGPIQVNGKTFSGAIPA